METILEETMLFPDPQFYQERNEGEIESSSASVIKKLSQDEAVRVLPVSIYSAEFVEPAHFPKVFGKALEQRVWVIVAKILNSVTRNTLKNLRKRMESVLDYTKYYDPYCNVKKSSVRIYLDPNYMHIILDTIMSRKMRNDILTCISDIKEIRPTMIILSKLNEMVVYKVPEDTKNVASVAQTIIMGRYIDRQKYQIPTKMYNEFPSVKLLPALNITASGTYEYKRTIPQKWCVFTNMLYICFTVRIVFVNQIVCLFCLAE